MRLSPGDTVDGYVLESVLGEGASATVYVARGPRGRVAIKVLKDAQARDRLAREASALASISSPHVVRILAVGARDATNPYIVMELVSGRTLESVLQSTRLEPPVVGTIIRQLALGLAAGHAAGVIHRDVKPANVMILEGEQLSVKLMDFGVAAKVAPDDRTRLTARGALIGTPDFVAPEQIQNPSGVGLEADLYSLGCVAYLMLSGRKPFVGNRMQVLSQHLEARPAPLDAFEGLGALTMQLLEKAPERRPTAAELVEQIDGLGLAGVTDWSSETYSGGTATHFVQSVPRVIVEDSSAETHPERSSSVWSNDGKMYAAAAIVSGAALLLLMWPESSPEVLTAAEVTDAPPEPPPKQLGVTLQVDAGVLADRVAGAPDASISTKSPLVTRPEKIATTPVSIPSEDASRPSSLDASITLAPDAAEPALAPAPSDPPPNSEKNRIERAIRDELALRALSMSDLSTAERTLIDDVRTSSPEVLSLRLDELRRALDAFEIGDDLLQRRLEGIRSLLRKRGTELDAAKLEPLENRYLDLRSKAKGASANERRRILISIADLDRDITSAK